MSTTQTPVEKAVGIVGTQAELARLIGVTPPVVNQWIKGVRPVPVEKCTAIERATSGGVRRWELRPDDWHRIWPELGKDKSAPTIPANASGET